jgi:AcrR family transcriptional regulator
MATTADARGAARTGRAAPLPPGERRRAILSAVQPVLLERGAAVTTRELAHAANVSEGTLFRVFADKHTLLREVVFAALDPATVVPELDAIDRSASLAERVARVLELGFDRVGLTMRWFGVLHELGRLDEDPASGPTAAEAKLEWARSQQSRQAQVTAAVGRVLEPDAAAFGRPLEQVTALLDVILVGAAVQQVHAARRGDAANTPQVDVLVDHFLHGVLAPITTRSPS